MNIENRFEVQFEDDSEVGFFFIEIMILVVIMGFLGIVVVFNVLLLWE